MTLWISFSWTSAALLAGHKTVTRRDWDADYARRFRAGREVIAYDKLPRNGGKPIARLRLTDDARYEPDAAAPDSEPRKRPSVLPAPGATADAGKSNITDE